MSEQISEQSLRVPRLLTGVGLFGVLVTAFELAARSWPGQVTSMLPFLALGGMTWLAWLVLRVRDRAGQFVTPTDRFLTYFAGPCSLVLLPLAGWFAFSNIDQVNGVNRFRSFWSQAGFEILMASGFVLSISALLSRPHQHASPQSLWRLVAIPLVLIFAMYAMFTPISCAAQRVGVT